jgi:hypothetical protein
MASGYYGYKPKVRDVSFSEGKEITLDILSEDKSLTGKYKIIAILGGSTAPLKLKNVENGKEYVLKLSIPTGNAYTLGTRQAHVANEYLAFKLYEAAGVNVPEIIELVKIEGTDYIGVLENFIENSTLKDILYPYSKVYNDENKDKAIAETFPIIQKDLLFHALFANWDINNNENIIIPKNASGEYEFNKPIIIDCGGTLFFRAQGGYKKAFGKEVKNIETLVASSLRMSDTGKIYPMPLYGFTDKTNIDKKSIVCEKWTNDKKEAILKAFDENKEIIRPYYNKGYGTIEELSEILNERIGDINKYCASVKNASSNDSGGASASASATKGGKRRSKTRKHKHHTKKTRRHRR